MICGIDEAGRGPLAGPVCAAAVVLPENFPVQLLGDSKKLNPIKREEARRVIVEKAVAWAVAWASCAEIDKINILQASLLAMQRAFEFLMPPLSGKSENQWPLKLETEKPFGRYFSHNVIPAGLSAIADGLHTPKLPVPCKALVKADSAVYEVMAASILAKTARDNLMEYYGRLYPEYGYEKHKGYPTKEHKKMIFKYGPSPIQRKSFAKFPIP